MAIFLVENNDRDDNLGDQIISRDLCELLSKFGDVYITGKPKAYHTANAAHFDLANSLWLRIRGALFGQRYYRVFPAGGWGRMRVSNRVLMSHRGILQKLRSRLKKRVEVRDILLGVSVEITADNSCFDDYFLVGARDQRTLANLGLRGQVKKCYFPDLSFFGPCRAGINQPRPNNWAISFRENSPEVTEDLGLDISTQAIMQVLSQLEDSTAAFYYQVEEDKITNQVLASAHQSATFRHEKLTLADYLEFYQQARFVASNRLHCLLLGAINGAVPIAMVRNTHWKVAEFFRTVGWDDLLISIDDPSRMVRVLQGISENFQHYVRLVDDTCQQQRELGFQLLASAVGSPRKEYRS